MISLGQAAFGKAKAAGVVLASATSIPVDSNAPIDTAGKSIEQVSSAICSFLRRSELEPEWLCAANLTDDPHEEAHGARHSRLWPECTALDRLSVSVCIGTSEGWIVHVDWITWRAGDDTVERRYSVMPLLRAKLLNRNQAWSLARVIAQKLDAA